jgi:Helix-turn-helix domain
MLPFVALPTAELHRMEAAHYKLMGVLLSFSDRTGKCFPGLRKIADRAGETLTWVQRHLKRMASLGYFKRARRTGTYVYHIHERFLVWLRHPNESRQRDSAQPRSTPANRPHDPQVYSQPESRQRDIRQSQEKHAQCLNKLGGVLGRDAPSEERQAPSEEDKAYVASRVAAATLALTGRAPKAPAELADPGAYAAEIQKRRLEGLACRVHRWLPSRFAGEHLMQAWTVLDARLKAPSRAALPREIRQSFDRLVTLYRSDSEVAKAERRVTHGRIRRWSFAKSRREDHV